MTKNCCLENLEHHSCCTHNETAPNQASFRCSNNLCTKKIPLSGILSFDFLALGKGLTYGLRRHSLACPADSQAPGHAPAIPSVLARMRGRSYSWLSSRPIRGSSGKSGCVEASGRTAMVPACDKDGKPGFVAAPDPNVMKS